MLKIECEYKRGILFVRLMGEINKTTIKNMEIVDNMIEKAGIRYLIINLEKATVINNKEITDLIQRYKNLIGNDGKILICGYYSPIKLNIDINDINTVCLSNKEINAFNMINI